MSTKKHSSNQLQKPNLTPNPQPAQGNNWQQFFDVIAPVYEREVFTRNTVAEIDFMVEELKLAASARVLDMGCGTGRHAIELARRGYQVTGVDISAGMLAQAKANAEKSGVQIDWVHCAAQEFVTQQPFDAVYSFCEGALCLFADDDDIWGKDMAVFAAMSEALKPEKPFMVNLLSAFRLLRSISDADVANGDVDLLTLTSRLETHVEIDGQKVGVKAIERYYTPPEIVRMVNRVGLKADRIYGGTAGNWRRGPIELDEYEFMVIGHRKPLQK